MNVQWMLICHEHIYDLDGAINTRTSITWPKTVPVAAKDEVFIFLGYPTDAVLCKCVVKNPLVKEYPPDEKQFVRDISFYQMEYMTLEVVESFPHDMFTKPALKQNGLTTVQMDSRISENLSKYLSKRPKKKTRFGMAAAVAAVAVFAGIGVAVSLSGKGISHSPETKPDSIAESQSEHLTVDDKAIIDTGKMETTEAEEKTNSRTKPIVVNNPGWDYYASNAVQTASKPTFSLVKKYQKSFYDQLEKGGFDQLDWFRDNGLEIDSIKWPFSDEEWDYHHMGDEKKRTLRLKRLESDNYIKYDFSSFSQPPDTGNYVNEQVTWAKVVGNMLYVSIDHDRMAEVAPQNAYLVAYDMDKDIVLWKSQPLVCNSENFVVYGDYIISGYGNTDEDDYLYVVSRLDGTIQESIPVAHSPEYLMLDQSQLYVMTYCDYYIFELK